MAIAYYLLVRNFQEKLIQHYVEKAKKKKKKHGKGPTNQSE